MKNSYIKMGKRILAATLTASLLFGCAPPNSKPTQSVTESTYEKFQAGKQTAQQQFDAFTDSVFKEEVVKNTVNFHYTLADPAARGLKDVPVTFGDFSLDHMKKELEEIKEMQKKLREINIRELTEEQKLTYQILDEFLTTELSAEGLELYSQPLTTTIGIQTQLPVLLAEYPFYSKQDADTYLALLSTIDTYYSQLIEFEKLKAEAGLFMSDASADHVVQSCEGYLIQPDHSFLYETFNTRIDGLEGLTQEEKDAYKAQNLKVLEEHFVPAYKILVDGLTGLMGKGTNEMGLYYYPKGKEYFEYLVNSNVGTSYQSVDDLKKAIEKQMAYDILALGKLTNEQPDTIEKVEAYEFRYKEPGEIMEVLRTQITEDFPELPECSYTIKYVPEALENALSPAFYLVPPIDRYKDNVIYINGNPRFESADRYTTLAHEGYPGHLYQNVYFLAKDTCDLRSVLSFSSYSEGWATYVEHYAYTLDNGLDPAVGKALAYNSSVVLAIYALLDIAINYEGWDQERVEKYLSNFFDVEGSNVAEDIYYSLVENPTNYMEYYVGYLEIREMRNTAEKVLKDDFDLKAFHTFLLDIGPAQFSIIQPQFQLWLEKQRG